jgi:hypothetical protein
VESGREGPLSIARDPSEVFRYTARGNRVAAMDSGVARIELDLAGYTRRLEQRIRDLESR